CLFQAEDGIRDFHVTGVQTCALPIYAVASPSLSVCAPGARHAILSTPAGQSLARCGLCRAGHAPGRCPAHPPDHVRHHAVVCLGLATRWAHRACCASARPRSSHADGYRSQVAAVQRHLVRSTLGGQILATDALDAAVATPSCNTGGLGTVSLG